MTVAVVDRLQCPYCQSTNVVVADGEYVCRDCGTVLGPVVAPTFNIVVPTVRLYSIMVDRERKESNKRHVETGRWLKYRLLKTELRKMERQVATEIEKRRRQAVAAKKKTHTEKVAEALSALCTALDIPRHECAQAFQLYNKKKLKLALQSSKPKYVAAVLVILTFGVKHTEVAKKAASHGIKLCTTDIRKLLRRVAKRLPHPRRPLPN